MKNGLAHMLALLVVTAVFYPINGYGDGSDIPAPSHMVDTNKKVYKDDRANDEHLLMVAEKGGRNESWHIVEEYLAGDLSIYSPEWIRGLDFRTLDIDAVANMLDLTNGMVQMCGNAVVETKNPDHRCVDYVIRAHLAVAEKVEQMDIVRFSKLVEKTKYFDGTVTFMRFMSLTNAKPASESKQAQEENKRITADIQTHLNKLGYDVGMVDGDKGTRTLAAIDQFKADNGFNEYKNYTDSQLLFELKKIAENKELQRVMLNEYVSNIQEKIQRNWIRPSSTDYELSCAVEVQLSTEGEVTDVQIMQSSGVPAFDVSVEETVYKASPLPMPPDPEVSERFRRLRFEFKPGDV
jgi:TonB family protein